ncbi:MAG: PD40 domain-containing protein [Planctomycetaceae bacterium]|nr:PD40 domain-containing protein [Planctomycetaceae bacterium]
MIQPDLLGLCRMLTTSLAISCLHAPISWSPDGRWFAFTTVDSANSEALRPGWLFDPQLIAPVVPGSPALLLRGQSSRTAPLRYRIWALERSTQSPVLIEESDSPLSSPVWRPDGRTLSYCRLVPGSPTVDPDRFRGRCELVLREALNRQRVIAAFPEVELDLAQRQAFVESRAAWSPDGRYLAVFRPGPAMAVVIVVPESGRVVTMMDRSSLPSWSPDGARVAMLMSGSNDRSDQALQLYERDLKSRRLIAPLGEVSEPPAWSPDGQSVWLVSTRPPLRSDDLELIRIAADTGVATRVLTVGSAPPGGRASGHLPTFGPDEVQLPTLESVSVGFDRDFEQCVLSVSSPGQPSAIALYNLRHQVCLKRFHPVDTNLQIGALAMHPEGRVLAVRIESPGSSAPPLLCELETESIRLIAPDARTRREWLNTLVGVARRLFQTLPEPTLNGQPAARVTVLPAPAEMGDQNPSSTRLRHLGRLGKALLDVVPPGPSDVDDATTGVEDECRLFFDYLRRDFKRAETQLDLVASRATAPEERFALLALRAQILLGQGLTEPARNVIDYLLHSGSSAAQCVEETPLGPVTTPADVPYRNWARYLAGTLNQKPQPTKPLPGDGSDAAEEGIDPRLSDPAMILNGGTNVDRVRNLVPWPKRVPGRGPAEPFPRGLQRAFPPPPPPARPILPGRPAPPRLGRGS